MKRAVVIAMWCVGVGVLAWVVMNHPGRDRVQQLEAELENLRAENQRIAEQNRELKRRIEALRHDPRALRRRARISAGLARPDELILQFDNPEAGGRLQIELSVTSDAVALAGETFGVDKLGDQLREARREFPTARLQVRFEEEVDARRRQVVLDTVRASAFRYRPEESEGRDAMQSDEAAADQMPDEG